LVGRPDGKSYLEDLDIDGRIILKWILKKWDGLLWLKIGRGGGLL